MSTRFDIVVIGGGHAGIEAAHAAARLGCATALVTMDPAAIGRMSCNPAIGGVAKGQLVRDVDALGGLMGLVADRAGIQFRMLNRSKGPAVWGPRAQMDMDRYAVLMQEELARTPNLVVLAGELHGFTGNFQSGYRLRLGAARHGTPSTAKAPDSFELDCRCLVITSGTFLGAVMHTGLEQQVGGRVGEPAAVELSRDLRERGLKTRRLKTGTPARLAADSIDYDATEVQHGDAEPFPFSFRTEGVLKNSATCWITRTGPDTHAILREGFDQSPMFTGRIQGIGPRYCPSIEDKIARFSDRDSHQLFLEPEGTTGAAAGRIYVNGFSSSLPAPVQDRALRTIPGLKECRVLRYGYAVEYDAVDATTLHPTFESRDPELAGLFFAGQVNGTSGYEEAAAQGLVAGLNAAHRVLGREPWVPGRAESYIGVLADDLASLEIDEPYRMFTSRAEYRLHLRQDNAEERLLEKGHALGLVDDATLAKYADRVRRRDALRAELAAARAVPAEINPFLEALGGSPLSVPEPVLGLLRRSEVELVPLLGHLGIAADRLSHTDLVALEATEKYQGYFDRQRREIERSKRLADLRIPDDYDFARAKGLSGEALQKLSLRRPRTVGEASRIAGITPADVSTLIYYVQKTGAMFNEQ